MLDWKISITGTKKIELMTMEEMEHSICGKMYFQKTHMYIINLNISMTNMYNEKLMFIYNKYFGNMENALKQKEKS